jgi:glycosyltransferase involved in cell wall biosynthesis
MPCMNGAIFLTLLLACFQLSSLTRFAICVCSYNNEKYIEWNLRSLLYQDYDEDYFHIYYMNDISTDSTLKKAKAFVADCSKEHLVTFIDNKEKRYQAGNYYHCIHDFIEDDTVVVTVDGDDALPHDRVLKYLDKVYSDPSIYLTYGQYIEKNSGKIGFNLELHPHTSERHLFRKHVEVFSHLRTFYAWLFKKIRKEDLLYQGSFCRTAGDVAIMFPMIEMANGHFKFIPEVLYIYNDNNPISDSAINTHAQVNMGSYFRHLRPYQPLDPVVAWNIRPYITRKLIEVE